MEAIVFLCLIIIVLCLVLPMVALAKASQAKRATDDLRAKIRDLEARMLTSRPAVAQSAAERAPEASLAEKAATAAPAPAPQPGPVPPPLPVIAQAAASLPSKTPPPPAPPTRPPVPAVPPKPPRPPINWEQFMGAKLFAWIGGLALFLGVAFFVKYAFDRHLISQEVQVAIGFLAGVALLVGGLALKRKENAVTSQTLCATGIVTLYLVTYACRAFYHFPFFGVIPTFVLMSLITVTAFLLAVRMDALVVAILGIAGGFLTPMLLSTGQDNPLAFFGYIALLDIGLLMVARRKNWIALPILGAVGTIVMQMAWCGNFFDSGKYYNGNKIFIPMGIFLGFEALFLALLATGKREAKIDRTLIGTAIAMAGMALVWGFFFLVYQPIYTRPVLLFSYVFVADIGLLAIVWLRERLGILSGITGLVVFLFLMAWTVDHLTNALLYVALGAYFIFALLHTSMPILLQRIRKTNVPWWCHVFPALALILVFVPILNLEQVSLFVWPLVLCIDILAILLAVFTGLLLPVLVVLLLTFVVLGGWMFSIPEQLTGLSTSLLLTGGFALFFIAIPIWAARRLLTRSGQHPGQGMLFGKPGEPANFAVQLPALSATLPFLLLIMVTVRLPLGDPSPVFALAFLLVIVLLGMAKIISLETLPTVGLVSTLALEHAWHMGHFVPKLAGLALPWYFGFAAVFTIFPFLFHKQFANKTLVWIVSALAAPLHFFLIYDTIRRTHPTSSVLGLVPALLAIPSLLGLWFLIKRTPIASASRMSQLALFGGAALFFITLIFPIQFDRQWITVGWALEGAALCWLFQRVPHPGLRIAGVGLLIVVFARLALNPAVLSYHAHSPMPILNWYLYAYGLGIVAMFAGARFLAPPRNVVLGTNALPVLYTFGTVLAFLLLNIEIADYFSAPNTSALTFQFSGNFARDMSYSIAWAAFALLLLIIGIRKHSAAVRYAALALLGVTVLKLFFHDLSQLQQLYRIAALIVVAAIAMLASFLYQRFLGAAPKEAAQ